MAFRFQKRIKLLPGITLNVSKGGVSTSVGVKGARVTVGRSQTRSTVGLPGTGLSLTSVVRNPKAQTPEPAPMIEHQKPRSGIAHALGRFIGRLFRR